MSPDTVRFSPIPPPGIAFRSRTALNQSCFPRTDAAPGFRLPRWTGRHPMQAVVGRALEGKR